MLIPPFAQTAVIVMDLFEAKKGLKKNINVRLEFPKRLCDAFVSFETFNGFVQFCARILSFALK